MKSLKNAGLILGIAIVAFGIGAGLRRLNPSNPTETTRPVDVVKRPSVPVLLAMGSPAEERTSSVGLSPRGPRIHLRSQDEWQGMLVDEESTHPCRLSSDCGMALACVDGRCGACKTDNHCADGEVCALDHCVTKAKASCRKRSDCSGNGELCILSGYTGGEVRGNRDMVSYCLSPDADKGLATTQGARRGVRANNVSEPASLPQQHLPVVPPESLFKDL